MAKIISENNLSAVLTGAKKYIDEKVAEVNAGVVEGFVSQEDYESKVGEIEAELAKKLEKSAIADFATESYVDTAVANAKSQIIGGAGQDYDTLKEIETWVLAHQDLYQALVSTVGSKASQEDFDELEGRVEDLEESAEAFATKSELADYVKENELDGKLGEYLESEKYVDEEWVNGQGFLTSTDINDMATQTWVKAQNYLTDHQSLAEYAKTSEVEEMISDFITEEDLVALTTVEVNAIITGVFGADYTT